MRLTMVPISGRLPDDLYEWLATTTMEDAATVSDKVRVAVAHLRRTYVGDSEYLSALNLYRDLGRTTREAIAKIEVTEQRHSEVLAACFEHLPALIATLNSAQVADASAAKQLESQLVRRVMQLTETLLRQGLTVQAAAFDGGVVKQHIAQVRELAHLIPSQPA
jgi:secreted Zn-dependent insulinase-like peptidase